MTLRDVNGGFIKDEARWADIEARFRSGQTKKEIGDFYGISRERIRQIIQKIGLTKTSLGVLRRKTQKEKNQEEMAKRVFKRYSLTVDEWREIIRTKGYVAFKNFKQHRLNARHRGVPFLMTFSEWWKVWKESGKWEKRGRKRGQYVMARTGDIGPYSVGNVSIITCSENIRDSYRRRG